MSYAIAYTADTQVGFRRLEILLQEEVLDAVDLVALNPDLLPRRSAAGSVVYDFVCEMSGFRHYVFITIEVDHVKRSLEISKIGHHAKPLPP
jgi:hypothetical protein